MGSERERYRKRWGQREMKGGGGESGGGERREKGRERKGERERAWREVRIEGKKKIMWEKEIYE